MKHLYLSLLFTVFLAGMASSAAAQTVRQPGEDVNDPTFRLRPGLHPNKNLLFNGWGITPVGEPVSTTDMPLKLVIAPDKKYLLAVHGGFNQHGVTVIDLATRKETQFLPLTASWNGLAFSPNGKQFYVSGGSTGLLHIFNYADGHATEDHQITPVTDDRSVFLAGVAVNSRTGKIYVCNEANDEILVLDPKTLALETSIPVGAHPHTCVIGGDGQHLYVSNWGGQSVSVVDMKQARRVRDIAVGLRPNDMALSPDGRLFVACAGDNSVHVLDTGHVEVDEHGPDRNHLIPEAAREIISTSLYPESPEGSTPDGLAVSPNGNTLFVANADNNDVMVVDISNSRSDKAQEDHESVSVVEGFIPVGWYPTAVAVSPDNQTLLVANGKGLASRANFPPVAGTPERRGKAKAKTKTMANSRAFDYIATTLKGSVSFITLPDAKEMVADTEQVRLNSPYEPDQFQKAPVPANSVIPAKVGDPCPIRYILYIIKENRTYDQVFGDFRDKNGKLAGNGSPNLTFYGEDVTPNHHQIARDYVLLDNLYCNGEVSADGHSWCDAAIATDYNERAWLLSYSKHGHLPGNDEMENPATGYLWDLCRRHGVTFKNYGEGSIRVPSANRGTWSRGRDMDRAALWIQDLHAAEKTGVLPQFMIMSLGEDHTKGTTPGAFTPDASVASNDLGLGRIVAAASHSPFWKNMAIFVIEDDAQNGPDHVDAHRTAGLVISPYCKRGVVDSTLYTTASMVRTMELILGLPPMTQYDAGATPMFNCFGQTAEVSLYEPLTPKVDLFARNTKKSPGAMESARMDFHDYDLAPEDKLNRILWADAKGINTPYPTPIHRMIFPAPSAPAAGAE
jgi:YVTN family beta-propeller protein